MADDWHDARLIATNIIHNIAFVHDAYNEVKQFFASEERGQARDGPYDAGFGAGRMLFFIFAENALNEQFDPAKGAKTPRFYFF